MMLRLLFLLPFLLCKIIYGENEYHIHNAGELIELSISVEKGTFYNGTTVYLDSDIDFSSEDTEDIKAIGTFSNGFQGTFDGQGHTISNLKMNESASEFAGLFGYSIGSTVKNVVVDESCFIMNSLISGNCYTGGLIAYCKSDNGVCTIENIVNMASVSFSGNMSKDMHLGGIAGVVWSSDNFLSSVRNCINYGTLTHEGIVGGYCNIGGIVGHCRDGKKHVQNCINYGTLSHAGTTYNKGIGGIGGIVGFVKYETSLHQEETTIENCLSAGRIESNTMDIPIGGVVGFMNFNTTSSIIHCFWTNETECDGLYGLNDSIVEEVNSSITEMDTETMQELNEYSKQISGGEAWGKTYTLHTNGGKIGDFNKDTMTVIGKEFPVPVKDENAFLFWCEDVECDVVYDPDNSSSSATDFYAAWNTSTVTFDFGNGSVTESVFLFKTTIIYPVDSEMVKEGYTSNGWDPRPDIATGHDITIIAQWTINNYTVTFDLGNGTVFENTLEFNENITYPEEGEIEREGYTFVWWDRNDTNVALNDLTITALWRANNYTVTFDQNRGDELSVKDMTVTFDEAYGELPEASREGYTFTGWTNEKSEIVTSESVVKIPKNHTLTAQWSINKYNVTFDFMNGTVIENTIEYGKKIDYPDNSEMTKEGYSFVVWDRNDTNVPAHNLVITALWKPNNYTVTFDFMNGTVVEKQSEFNTVITYPENPEMTKEGYSFARWDRNDTNVPAHNLTITAQWTPNNYTVILNTNGGDDLPVKEITVTFDSVYGTLPTPTREGYTFINWFNEINESVTSESIANIPRNHTLTAQWKHVPTSQVEIVFGTKDLTEKDIKDIVSQYAKKGDFTIIKIDDKDAGEIRVIIKFNDAEQAENFIETIKMSSEATKGLIKGIDYVSEVASFSPTYNIHPLMLFFALYN